MDEFVCHCFASMTTSRFLLTLFSSFPWSIQSSLGATAAEQSIVPVAQCQNSQLTCWFSGLGISCVWIFLMCISGNASMEKICLFNWECTLDSLGTCICSKLSVVYTLYLYSGTALQSSLSKGRNTQYRAQTWRLHGRESKTIPLQLDVSGTSAFLPSSCSAYCCAGMLITLVKTECTFHLVQWQKSHQYEDSGWGFDPFASFVCQSFLAQSLVFSMPPLISKTKRKTIWAVQP